MYQALAFLHILAAVIWIGGMLFIALVMAPAVRRMQEPPGASARVLRMAAQRFRGIAWLMLAFLVATGLWMLIERGVNPLDIFTAPGTFMDTLRVKVIFVLVALALAALHDFVLGPRVAQRLERLGRAANGDPRLARQRRLLSWLARVNVLIALSVLALGVFLVRGLPL